MAGYTYAPKKAEPPKGMYHSIYGGFERTPLAMYPTGATLVLITRNMSGDARRARIRARKREKLLVEFTEREIADALAQADALEARATKEFHNGG